MACSAYTQEPPGAQEHGSQHTTSQQSPQHPAVMESIGAVSSTGGFSLAYLNVTSSVQRVTMEERVKWPVTIHILGAQKPHWELGSPQCTLPRTALASEMGIPRRTSKTQLTSCPLLGRIRQRQDLTVYLRLASNSWQSFCLSFTQS